MTQVVGMLLSIRYTMMSVVFKYGSKLYYDE